MKADLLLVVRKWYAIVPPLVMPVTMFINAPFGRFALKKDAWLQFDGVYYIDSLIESILQAQCI